VSMDKIIKMSKITFELLLLQAISDYKESTEDDERSSVVQKLIDDLENPEEIN